MARQRGEVDVAKRNAVLNAALDLFSRSGSMISLSAVAQCAGVSRQTLYNQYHSKSELIAALLARSCATNAPPEIDQRGGATKEALTSYSVALLAHVLAPEQAKLSRLLALNAGADADDRQLAQTLFMPAAKRGVASFFVEARRQGRVRLDDPVAAAELFVDLLTAPHQLHAVLGQADHLDSAEIHGRATACVELFLAAYAPPIQAAARLGFGRPVQP